MPSPTRKTSSIFRTEYERQFGWKTPRYDTPSLLDQYKKDVSTGVHVAQLNEGTQVREGDIRRSMGVQAGEGGIRHTSLRDIRPDDSHAVYHHGLSAGRALNHATQTIPITPQQQQQHSLHTSPQRQVMPPPQATSRPFAAHDAMPVMQQPYVPPHDAYPHVSPQRFAPSAMDAHPMHPTYPYQATEPTQPMMQPHPSQAVSPTPQHAAGKSPAAQAEARLYSRSVSQQPSHATRPYANAGERSHRIKSFHDAYQMAKRAKSPSSAKDLRYAERMLNLFEPAFESEYGREYPDWSKQVSRASTRPTSAASRHRHHRTTPQPSYRPPAPPQQPAPPLHATTPTRGRTLYPRGGHATYVRPSAPPYDPPPPPPQEPQHDVYGYGAEPFEPMPVSYAQAPTGSPTHGRGPLAPLPAPPPRSPSATSWLSSLAETGHRGGSGSVVGGSVATSVAAAFRARSPHPNRRRREKRHFTDAYLDQTLDVFHPAMAEDADAHRVACLGRSPVSRLMPASPATALGERQRFMYRPPREAWVEPELSLHDSFDLAQRTLEKAQERRRGRYGEP